MKRRVFCSLLAIIFVIPLTLSLATAQTRLLIGTGGLAGVYYPIRRPIYRIIRIQWINFTHKPNSNGPLWFCTYLTGYFS